MSGPGRGKGTSLTGKPLICLEAYRLRGAGMNTAAFFERYKEEFSKNSHYAWRSGLKGYAEAWDKLEAKNVTHDDEADDFSLGDILEERFARWLSSYESNGNRGIACKDAGLTTDEIEEELESNDLFAKRVREIEKLWDWEVEDVLRLRARDGVVAAQKAWLQSRVPAFKKSLTLDVNNRVTLELSDVRGATEKLIEKRGAYRPELPSGEEDIIDVESKVVD